LSSVIRADDAAAIDGHGPIVVVQARAIRHIGVTERPSKPLVDSDVVAAART